MGRLEDPDRSGSVGAKAAAGLCVWTAGIGERLTRLSVIAEQTMSCQQAKAR